jgi:hypothetical protein
MVRTLQKRLLAGIPGILFELRHLERSDGAGLPEIYLSKDIAGRSWCSRYFGKLGNCSCVSLIRCIHAPISMTVLWFRFGSPYRECTASVHIIAAHLPNAVILSVVERSVFPRILLTEGSAVDTSQVRIGVISMTVLWLCGFKVSACFSNS